MKLILHIIIVLAVLYGILWFMSMRSYAVEYGISFNQNHARSLGLDWKQTYQAMLDELKPKYLRIAAMWSEVQKENKDNFDYTDVDWMMNRAREAGIRVVLVVGQKAPRWPECHVPAWIEGYSSDDAEEDLYNYVKTTVERYKDHDALEIWQVENEPYINFKFGECDNYRQDLVEKEVKLVRDIDQNHPIMITDSGELSTWRKPIKLGDYFGTTLYRVVRTPKGKIFTYDWLPASFYRLKAQLWGKDLNTFFVAELQAEPWFTDAGAENTPVEEQERTMSPERLQKHFDYTERIGAPRAYLWGVEWWYWIKKEHDDSRYWDMVKEKIEKSNIETPEQI